TSYGEDKRKIEQDFRQIQQKMFEYASKEMVTHKKTLETQTLKLSEWNPFSDEASSWFDPEWMFEVKDGFDIVIANPPYVRQEDIKHLKPSLQKQGFEVYNSTSDLYTYFYEKAHQVLGQRGVFCFISSNKFMRAKYGEKLRRLLQENTALKQIIDFGGHKVFESATVDTCIVVFVKEKKDNNTVCLLNIADDFTPQTDIQLYFAQKGFCLPQSKLSAQHWTLADDSILRLKEKIEKAGTPLKDWDVKIYRGIITGFNEAFIIDNETKERLCQEDSKSIEVLKPILRGRDISRYSYKWAGLWLIKIESGWTNKNRGKKDPESFFKNTYPAIYEHLKSMGEKKGKGKGLYQRDDQGDYWWELRDCNYYDEFEKEKLIYRDVGDNLSFAYEQGKLYGNNTVYFLNTGNKYLLAVLNSLLLNFYYTKISSQLGDAASRAFTIFIEQLPILKIPETKQQPFISLVDQILAAKKKDPNAVTSALERQIDKLVYELYELTPEELDIVEGVKLP
ncbi:MAG: class I SAM-dependent DNA methyltransferase, partial [Nitrospira sp.]|nr:class I SAM-dependent DNA methyltransferase [Nitrospira sp.]